LGGFVGGTTIVEKNDDPPWHTNRPLSTQFVTSLDSNTPIFDCSTEILPVTKMIYISSLPHTKRRSGMPFCGFDPAPKLLSFFQIDFGHLSWRRQQFLAVQPKFIINGEIFFFVIFISEHNI